MQLFTIRFCKKYLFEDWGKFDKILYIWPSPLMNPLEFPKLQKYVNDFSWVLSSDESFEQNELLHAHETKTTEQVLVVLFPHREGHELLDIGLKIFNENGIGQKWQNNGLLLVIATEEKKIRIITGKGMEIKYSEMRCRDIIENQLRPLLNQGKYLELIRKFASIVDSTETYEDSLAIKNLKQSRDVNKIFTIVWGMISFFASIFADSFLMGLFTIALSILFYGIFMKLQKTLKVQIGKFAYIFIFLLLLIWILAIVRPADCTLLSETYLTGKNYHCERNIFGYNFAYSKSFGGHMTSSSNGSSSSSHYDGWGSSFGGGGGSSNGWGFGD